jgi:hypothetical protein
MYPSSVTFDPQLFSGRAIPLPKRGLRPSPQRTAGRFLKGPIPLDWLAGPPAFRAKPCRWDYCSGISRASTNDVKISRWPPLRRCQCSA